MFSLILALFFLSSMAMPRDLITEDWFKTIATVNPLSYPIEAARSLFITGWDAEALALGAGIGVVILLVGLTMSVALLRQRGDERPHAVGGARVAALNFRSILKGPAKMLPPLLVPLFFFVAFKGALSGVGDSKDFGYYDFTAFEFVLILFMAAMFVGAFTSFDIVDAYEGGLGRRLMAGAPRRMAIIFGFLIVNVGRPARHGTRLGRRPGNGNGGARRRPGHRRSTASRCS